jgi:hypothetical protein
MSNKVQFEEVSDSELFTDDDEDYSDEVPLADEQGNLKKKIMPDPKEIARQAYRAQPEPIIPSKAGINNMVAQKIVENTAQKAQSSLNKPLTEKEVTKVVKNMKEGVPDPVDEKIRIARRLNDKRQTYQKRIQYKFKPHYDPTKMSIDQLKHEEYEVDTIINSQDVPTILKDGVLAVTGLMERLMVAFGFPLANGYRKNMEINFTSNHFDQELEQLAIELKDYFARPPAQRMLLKSGMIFFRTVEQNQLAYTTNVKPNIVDRTKDL